MIFDDRLYLYTFVPMRNVDSYISYFKYVRCHIHELLPLALAWYKQYMANNLLTKYGLVRTRCGSYCSCSRRLFYRRWLSGGRCISRRSLLRCCRFNTGRRVLQGCRNNCNITTLP